MDFFCFFIFLFSQYSMQKISPKDTHNHSHRRGWIIKWEMGDWGQKIIGDGVLGAKNNAGWEIEGQK